MASVHKIRQVLLVGRKIRRLRKDYNLTQTELSARIGIQQSDLSRMEKGEYRRLGQSVVDHVGRDVHP